ncbi:beta-glucosidase 18-like isoform X1 [Olea europaea var. sylvestris]|uniref:beta-glucosidase 18-like isoform X1 n=1 Tax=Olea europaea var. sylvestris TaxID=158386 RepID=UPI000C1D7C63|nr:beta-glucosidase 18-like isoform X1 [Olea europaea var. sylvestris]
MWKKFSSTITIVFLILCAAANSIVKASFEDEVDIKRSDFPDGFLFGAATSSYQIEGANLEDGRSLCNWDVFCHIKGSIANGDSADIAEDHYNRYMEDIEILHSLGVDAYRFSISWSRVLPSMHFLSPFERFHCSCFFLSWVVVFDKHICDYGGGKFGGVNQAGILFYNKIIDNLLSRGAMPNDYLIKCFLLFKQICFIADNSKFSAGIEPFVTIHHFDYPQELENRYGGWLSHLMQEDFVHFAEICFQSFGDRVKYWCTINEPNLFSEFAYERGTYPPAHCSPPFGNCSTGNSDVEPLIAVHNMLLGHAKTVKIYRERFKSEQRGVVGIVVHSFMYKPLTEDKRDKEAADRALAFNIAWILDPVVFGDYPPEMRHYHGSELPKFASEERIILRDSIDFIGINHYATLYAKDCIYSSCICNDSSCTKGSDRAIRGFVYTAAERDGVPIGEPTGMARFFVVPRGMEEIVEYAKKRYLNKPMFVTENGYSSPLNKVEDYHHDVKRINYLKSYLAFLARAIRNGADVRGYFLWTLMDDFEWVNGYSVRFGIYRVDPQTLNRTPKLSASWFRNFLSNCSLNYVESCNSISLMNTDESRAQSE